MKGKLQRLTLAKAIANETTISRKWSVAAGQSLLENFAPDSELKLQSILEKWRAYDLLRKQGSDSMNDPRILIAGKTPSITRKAMLEEFAELGFLTATAIMDGNHQFFSHLATRVQFNKKPLTQKLYFDILDICKWSGSGDARRPCDAMSLYNQLVKRGHKFSTDHANQIPPAFRAVCKRLGVVLNSKGRGRPRINK